MIVAGSGTLSISSVVPIYGPTAIDVRIQQNEGRHGRT
jgi:hypothetical protein